MPLFEDRSASFIMRVWCETGDGEVRTVRVWRGSIEHVNSRQRVFFRELDAVISFMKPHLVALGIEEPNRFWERMSEALVESANPQPPTLDAASSTPGCLPGRAKMPRDNH